MKTYLKTYVTKSGEMFDEIAHKILGSVNHTERLINANREHVATLKFSAGVELRIPEVEAKRAVKLPPWMRS